MKMCNGCRHLSMNDLCDAMARPAEREENPVTGRVRYVVRGHDGSVFKPTAIRMREAGAPCGPERLLYAPSLLARVFPWAFGAQSRARTN